MMNIKFITILVVFISTFTFVSGQEYLKENTDGKVSLEIEKLTDNFLIGLTPPFRTRDEDISQYIAYSFLVSNGDLFIMEYGKVVMTGGSLSVGDSIRIKREGSYIKYFKNEINIKTIYTDPNYKLAIYRLGKDIPIVKSGFRGRFSSTAFISNITVNDTDESGIIDVNPVGGVSPYIYRWTHNDATTKCVNNLAVGNYEVVITDSEGQELRQNYEISYLVTATVPNTFILDSGLIVKARNSGNKEMMVSENKVNGDGYFSAVFIGEEISFVFGLNSDKDQHDDAQRINYGVLAIQNQLYFIKDGGVVADLGQYESNLELSFQIYNNGTSLIVNLGETKIFSIDLEQGVYYSTMALSKDYGGLKKWSTYYRWKPTDESDFYATLTKKLDGSFYTFKNYIKFKYKEKYNTSIIDYKIYNWKRELKMSQPNQPISDHKYGINYHKLAAFNQLDSDTEGYYTLEVENDKGEIYKMRFYFEKVGTNGIILVPTILNPTLGAPACCFENNPCELKICTTPIVVVNPCNPCN